MRKTNLFYTSGIDSKFLTFSNYTESLTGNFLSTNTKLYPSMFLCLKINKLSSNGKIDASAKKDFVNNYLVAYYENKLACLRDDIIYNNQNAENYVAPLAYLLKAIYDYDNSFEICYVGDITEQDFNGTYTDTICIVDVSKFKYATVVSSSSSDNTRILDIKDEYDGQEGWDADKLHGWASQELDSWMTQEEIDDLSPQYDEDPTNGSGNYSASIYNYDEPYAQSLKLLDNKTNAVSFNVIVPLFDVVDFNYNTNDTTLSSNITSIDLRPLKKYGDAYRKNVPLGIWFADSDISLSKDDNTGFAQSWSLVITSQFKPFPYAKMQPNNPNDLSISNAFPTFAMILSRQNEVLDKFNEIQSLVIAQNSRITQLEAKLNNTDTAYNIDKVKRDFINYEYDMTNKFNSLKQEMYDYLDKLRWKSAE